MGHKITVLGLGPDNIDLLTLKANEILLSEHKIVFRTKICEAAKYLDIKNKKYESADFLYENAEDFNSLEKDIAEYIIALAKDNKLLTLNTAEKVFDLVLRCAISRRYSKLCHFFVMDNQLDNHQQGLFLLPSSQTIV